MNKISILKNPIQDYAWGSRTEIQNLIGESGSADKPMAELWMGAHPKAPSEVLFDEKWQSLHDVIEKYPEPVLGIRTAKRFSNRLPFLFKILAAERPLSVQVHPNRKQAQEGFARENDLKIPLDGPNRNYKDDNHKPEIFCALTGFQGLKGFREIKEILILIDRLSLTTLTHELAFLQKRPDRQGLKSFFSALMNMDKLRQKEVAEEAVKNAEKLTNGDQIYHWVIELNKEYPGDIGILSPLILNLVLLEPGEAVYLSAGEPHAYLHGLGIELMANSDNVLRGGLTPKHVEVPELLKIVKFETGPVRKIEPETIDGCRTIYESPAREFLLSRISVDEGNAFISPSDRSVEILICFKGKAEIEDFERGDHMPLTRGKSVIIPSAVPQYGISGNATFYMASVPV